MKSFRHANRSSLLWNVVLMIILASGCTELRPVNHTPPPDTKTVYTKSAPFADSVVFSTKQIPSMGGYFNLDPTWDPPEAAVSQSKEQLPAFLNHVDTTSLPYPLYADVFAKELPGLIKRLPTTVCQIVGVTYEGHKGLLLNCLPMNHSFSKNWREQFANVHDGGPRFWSVVYLPDEQRFAHLHIDLGY